MANNVDYGSLEDQADKGSFDETNTYYLKETPLTREQKIRKFVLIAIPILAAVVIVGGFALFLLKDFSSLYPGRQGSGNEPVFSPPPPRIKHDAGGEKAPMKSSPASSPSFPSDEKKSESDMPSSCLAHEKCTGLVGECCPTVEGKFLDCCN